jgi:hypothetical protein
MNILDVNLMPAELDALLETIRRDFRAQSLQGALPTFEQNLHRANARMCIRLLEILNPKRQAIKKICVTSISEVGRGT